MFKAILSFFFALALPALGWGVEAPWSSGPITITATNDIIPTVPNNAGRKGFVVHVTGLTVTAALNVEGCTMGTCGSTDWFKIPFVAIPGGASSITITANGTYAGSAPSGTRSLRIRAASLAGAARVSLAWGEEDTSASLAALVGTGASAPSGAALAALTSTVGTWSRITATAYAGLTTNANTTIGLTATAGSGFSQYLVKVGCNTGSGMTGLNYVTHNGATPPGTFSLVYGSEVQVGDYHFLPPLLKSDGVWYLSFVARGLSGATSGTMWYEIYGR